MKRDHNSRAEKAILGSRYARTSSRRHLALIVCSRQIRLVHFCNAFYQHCPLTDSLHRLGFRFARTSSVPLEIKLCICFHLSGLSCMSANCDSLAAEDFVLAHISVENVRDMYNQLSFRDFVLSHPQLRFCPGTNCKLIIKAVLPVAKRVHCTSCKSSFW